MWAAADAGEGRVVRVSGEDLTTRDERGRFVRTLERWWFLGRPRLGFAERGDRRRR